MSVEIEASGETGRQMREFGEWNRRGIERRYNEGNRQGAKGNRREQMMQKCKLKGGWERSDGGWKVITLATSDSEVELVTLQLTQETKKGNTTEIWVRRLKLEGMGEKGGTKVVIGMKRGRRRNGGEMAGNDEVLGFGVGSPETD